MERTSLRRFAEVSQDPLGYLRDERDRHGKRVVGCFPMYVPEELIHAAGLQPAVVLVDSRMTLDFAGRHVQSFFCGQARALLELGLRKDLSFLAGMVFGDTRVIELRGKAPQQAGESELIITLASPRRFTPCLLTSLAGKKVQVKWE